MAPDQVAAGSPDQVNIIGGEKMKYVYSERSADTWYYTMLRAHANVTVDQVAEICETSAKTVYRFERGQYKRASAPIIRLQEYYDELHENLLKTVLEKDKEIKEGKHYGKQINLWTVCRDIWQ